MKEKRIVLPRTAQSLSWFLLRYAGVMLRRFSAEASRVFCQRRRLCTRDPSGLNPAQSGASLRWHSELRQVCDLNF